MQDVFDDIDVEGASLVRFNAFGFVVSRHAVPPTEKGRVIVLEHYSPCVFRSSVVELPNDIAVGVCARADRTLLRLIIYFD